MEKFPGALSCGELGERGHVSREVTRCKLCFRRLGVWTEEELRRAEMHLNCAVNTCQISLTVGDGRETRGERVFFKRISTFLLQPITSCGSGEKEYIIGTEASCPGAMFKRCFKQIGAPGLLGRLGGAHV